MSHDHNSHDRINPATHIALALVLVVVAMTFWRGTGACRGRA